MSGSVPYVEQETREYAPLEKHVAESQWQTCNCKSCQDRRHLIDSRPGKPVDYAKYRRSDEKY